MISTKILESLRNVFLAKPTERERELLPELVEDVTADGDGLETFDDGLVVYVADWANGFPKCVVAIDHLSLLSLYLSLSNRGPATVRETIPKIISWCQFDFETLPMWIYNMSIYIYVDLSSITIYEYIRI